MSEYPRELLITEDVIREFEEVVGVRFINKTECAKALKAHDAKIRAEALNRFAKWLETSDYLNQVDIDYDYEEESYETVNGLTAEEVIEQYKSILNDDNQNVKEQKNETT